ncbi:MAG: mercuric reductase [Chloroflexota bacterium]|nr:mercuric reductase [Chloroflexota bacterium]
MTTQQYDAIVIGSGQAGGPLATALVGAGRKTALIEREHVGGTCINEGCTPSKTMVASARVAHLARRGADYGVHTGAVRIAMDTVRRRKRDMVESFRTGSESRITEGGVDLLDGEARFTGPKEIAVRLKDGETLHLHADLVVLNVGARPAVPPVEGIEDVPYLNSTTIMELNSVPERLLILGGGYIGLEFAQMFRRFGSEVTIVQRGKQLLSREDEDIAAEVAKILREDGIEVLLETDAQRVETAGDGDVRLTVRSGEEELQITGSHLLAGVGRTPNTDVLNLEAAGVETDKKGYVRVNERLETSAPGVYALGDVKGGPAFTHVSYDDFRVLEANLLDGGDRTTTDRVIPYTVFIDPQLGRVGLSETQAREQGKKIRVAKIPMSSVARALETDEPRGLMKAVVDAETEEILGAAVLGLEGGEVAAMLQIAMMGKLPYTALRDGVFSHPTLSESLNSLFGSFTEE